MRRSGYLYSSLVILFGVSTAFGQSEKTVATKAPAPLASDNTAGNRQLVNQYCVVCHNQTLKTGGFILDKVDVGAVTEHPEVWEKVWRKMSAGLMPPQGMPRPDKAKMDGFVSMLETTLDQAALAKPNPGPALLRRLTRTEYGNAVRDLLGLKIEISTLLPGDGYSNEGFDNDASTLTISPVLMEQYLAAAWEISSLAVGSTKTDTSIDTFKVRPDLSQDHHIDGLPVGTRGGMVVHYNFPVDGDYVFKPKIWQNNAKQVRGVETPSQFVVSIDGQRVHLAEFGGPADEAFSVNAHLAAAQVINKKMEARVHVKAGPHDVGFAFVRQSSAEPIDLVQALQRENFNGSENAGIPYLDSATIAGPMNPEGAGVTPSRRQIFICKPSNDNSDQGACARRILTRLARLAYRRPLSAEDTKELLRMYEIGRKQQGAEAGVETAISYILASPKFVFRAEDNSASVSTGTAFHVSDYDFATRLSFFLWSSIPDDELLTLAGQGKLKDPAVVRQQVTRMLADPRSSALVYNFSDEWLHLRNLKAAIPVDTIFPDFDDNLRQGFQKETELFFESILRENRSALDLLSANYTFLNQRLAIHYGIPNVYGSQFRRVTLKDENRWGLLGQGSILTVTSYGNRTSPVIRGKYVLSSILGNPPPPPPPDVPALNETTDANKPQTMRQRLEAHRANPVCANCHRLMDPIGFALENFDGIGRYRTSEDGVPIDASGMLADGTKINGPIALRKAILNRPEVFIRTLTEALLTYAIGRAPGPYDMPSVRAIVRNASHENNTLESLIQGVVSSTAFQMRVKEPGGVTTKAGGISTASNVPVKPIEKTSASVH